MIVGWVGLSCVSKSNSRRLVRRGRKGLMSIKSKPALAFLESLKGLTPHPIEGEVAAAVLATYLNRLPDLDVELLWDGLQGVAYKNDRQVREKHVYHAVGIPQTTFALWRREEEPVPTLKDLLLWQQRLGGTNERRMEAGLRSSDQEGREGLYHLDCW